MNSHKINALSRWDYDLEQGALIKACLHQLEALGFTIDEQLVSINSEEKLIFNTKFLVLLLDGQKYQKRGRFASLVVDEKYNIVSFAVFERLEDSSVQLLRISPSIDSP